LGIDDGGNSAHRCIVMGSVVSFNEFTRSITTGWAKNQLFESSFTRRGNHYSTFCPSSGDEISGEIGGV
jgi:hypothetical protein